MNKKISIYSDIRVICTLLVVAGHCSSLYLTNKNGITNLNFICSAGYYTEFLRKIIYSFHMPLFVSLSGAVFSLTIEKQKDFFSFIKKKVERLIIPFYLIGFFVLFPVRIFVGYYDTINVCFGYSLFRDYFLAYDVNYLWYLLMLFNISVLFFLYLNKRHEISKKEKKGVFVLLFLVSFCSFVLPEMPFQFNKVLEFSFWFYTGVLLDIFRRNHRNCKLKPSVLMIMWAISFVVYSWIEIYVNDYPNIIYFLKAVKMIVRYIMEGSAILTVFQLLDRYPLRQGKLYSIIERNSMTIYLFHCPLIYIYKYLFCKIPGIANISNMTYVLLLSIGILSSVTISIIIGESYTALKRHV